MKFKIYDPIHEQRTLNFGLFKIGTFCGERWYRKRSWKNYPLVKFYHHGGFSIGPILFWDGR